MNIHDLLSPSASHDWMDDVCEHWDPTLVWLCLRDGRLASGENAKRLDGLAARALEDISAGGIFSPLSPGQLPSAWPNGVYEGQDRNWLRPLDRPFSFPQDMQGQWIIPETESLLKITPFAGMVASGFNPFEPWSGRNGEWFFELVLGRMQYVSTRGLQTALLEQMLASPHCPPLEQLEARRVRLEMANWSRKTPLPWLHALVRRPSANAAKVLLEHGFSIDALDDAGRSVLSHVRSGAAVEWALAAGAPLHNLDKNGETAIFHVFDPGAFRALVLAGLDPALRNSAGKEFSEMWRGAGLKETEIAAVVDGIPLWIAERQLQQLDVAVASAPASKARM